MPLIEGNMEISREGQRCPAIVFGSLWQGCLKAQLPTPGGAVAVSLLLRHLSWTHSQSTERIPHSLPIVCSLGLSNRLLAAQPSLHFKIINCHITFRLLDWPQKFTSILTIAEPGNVCLRCIFCESPGLVIPEPGLQSPVLLITCWFHRIP